ncbi:MAG TPA: helix-turn-helix domain-containing protein [Actinomycetota bacterium]
MNLPRHHDRSEDATNSHPPIGTTQDTMQLETVGEIVRILRGRRDLEQVELARACGWRDASAVSRIETDRIRPTRRTLVKLANALADENTTGARQDIQAWLFRAAGVLPTADEFQQLSEKLPRIETWGQPAMIMDFGWTLWTANDLAVKMLGLPARYSGRNYLELLFEAPGSVRSHLGDRWELIAASTLMEFRAETDRQADRRWRVKLIARLMSMPDFDHLWEASQPSPRGEVFQRRRYQRGDGAVAMVRLTLTADPRLVLTHIIPEDQAMTRTLLEAGLVLA